MDTHTRLRLATRIHFALLRHLGDSVDVQDILHRPAQTREVLWVCEGSGDDELVALAVQFRQASLPSAGGAGSVATTAAAPATAAPQPSTAAQPATTRRRSGMTIRPQNTSWGTDSSGFGASRPADLASPAPKSERDWLKPRTWLRTR